MQATSDVTEIELSYRRHGSALLLFAAALAGERSRAQDAVQQVFLKLLESGSLGERTARQRDVALDPEGAWFEPPDRDYVAEGSLRRALWALPEDQREVIVLHIWVVPTLA